MTKSVVAQKKDIRHFFFKAVVCVALILSVCRTASGTESDHSSGSIIIEEHTRYIIKNTKCAKLLKSATIKILNDEGKTSGNMVLYENDFRKLKKFSATVLDESMNEIYSMKKKDGFKSCGASSAIKYEDFCYYYFNPSGGSYPYYIKYEYEYDIKSLFFWNPWIPWKDIPVNKATYTLIAPKDFKFQYLTYGGITEPNISERKGKITYYWERSDIPAMEEESYSVIDRTDYPAVQFSPNIYKFGNYKMDGTDWSTLSRGFFQMTKKTMEPYEQLVSFAEELGAQGLNARQIINALHKKLCKKMRYIALEIGIGGWVPYTCNETFSRGYGDCKDLSTLYISVLNLLGIEAHTVLALTRTRGAILSEVPVLNQFNHAIFFAIDENGDTIWVDPTWQNCPAGDLPYTVENIMVLPITEKGDGLIYTPASSPEENMIHRRVELTMTNNQTADCIFVIRLTGNTAHWWKNQDESNAYRDNLKRLAMHDYIGISEKVRLDSMICDTLNTSPSECKIRFYGQILNAALSIENQYYLNLSFLLSLRNRESMVRSDLKNDLNLEFPISYVDSIIIKLPENWQATDQPIEAALSDQFGSISITSETADGVFILNRQIVSNRYLIDRDELPEYVEHIYRCKKMLPEHIAFSSLSD